MCGRYQFTEPQNADLRRILQDVRRRCGDRAQDFRFGDVMPTAAAPVLIANGGKVVADLQTWGIPGWIFEIKRAGKGRGRPDAARTLPVAMEAITAAGSAAFEGGGTPSLKNAGASGRVA